MGKPRKGERELERKVAVWSRRRLQKQVERQIVEQRKRINIGGIVDLVFI
jgi:hypothetical protein